MHGKFDFTSKYGVKQYKTPTFCRSLAMLVLAKKYGIHTSPAQFLFFLSWLLSGSILLNHIISRKENGQDDFHEYDEEITDRVFISYCFQCGLNLMLFLLNFLADGSPKKHEESIKIMEKQCPQTYASFASILTYFWATPLIWKGKLC